MEIRRLENPDDYFAVFEAIQRVDAREAGPSVERLIDRVLVGEFGYDPDLMTAAVAMVRVFRAEPTNKAEIEAVRIARKLAGFAPRVRGHETRYDSNDPHLREQGQRIAQRFVLGDITRAEALRELRELVGGSPTTRARLLGDLCNIFKPPSER